MVNFKIIIVLVMLAIAGSGAFKVWMFTNGLKDRIESLKGSLRDAQKGLEDMAKEIAEYASALDGSNATIDRLLEERDAVQETIRKYYRKDRENNRELLELRRELDEIEKDECSDVAVPVDALRLLSTAREGDSDSEGVYQE